MVLLFENTKNQLVIIMLIFFALVCYQSSREGDEFCDDYENILV